ncbi:hypothetical protein EKO27_g2942 [Xylaria grammica]|uniref:Major facilitator superfamily (MFS) profile domain-containing protein n=1 Tax=Xylaria grammica TaxID=363999 RepID=A0A439DCQ5_9PEZI|nr:hypothetical protein EKO27_g2942 [Xylaria grammica]
MPLFAPEDVNTPVLSQFSLKNKVAAVTGGARGIGVQVVRGLAEAGTDVALIYSNSSDAPEIATKISMETGVRVETFQCDVRSRDDAARVVDEIASKFGRLDVMVANAGVCANIPNLEYTEETWKSNNSVNLDGVMWTAQAAGRIFKKQGRGNLIITASVSAILVNIPQTQAAYKASKAAVDKLWFFFFFIIILFATVPWLPESPRWLIAHQHVNEAIPIIAALEEKDSDDVVVVKTLQDIQYSVSYELEHSIPWKYLLRGKKGDGHDTKTLRRLLLGAGTQFMQQFGGINIMSYYLPTVGQQLAFLAITIILRFVDISANSMLGVPWLYPTEINCLPLRTKGAAVATCTNWITNSIIVEITPIGINNLGWKFWIVWTLTNTAFLPIIYFVYPETANRTLEDLDFYYRSNPSLIVTTNRAVTSSKRPQEYINREQEEMAEIRRRASVHEAYNKNAANQ